MTFTGVLSALLKVYESSPFFLFQANVQQSPVKTAVLALETTDVNAHFPFTVLSVTGRADWEPKRTRHPTLKESLTPEKVRAAVCIGYNPQMKQLPLKRTAT